MVSGLIVHEILEKLVKNHRYIVGKIPTIVHQGGKWNGLFCFYLALFIQFTPIFLTVLV
jgi:hypothetical protein